MTKRNYKATFILDNRGKEDSVDQIIEGVKKEIAAVQGEVTAVEQLGRRVDSLVPSWVDEPTTSRDRVNGVVITIDHFGNLITNVGQASCSGFVDPIVHAGKLALPLRRTYGDVTPGDPIALFNSFGVIEIAVAERRAADVLGLSRGAPITVRDGVRRI